MKVKFLIALRIALVVAVSVVMTDVMRSTQEVINFSNVCERELEEEELSENFSGEISVESRYTGNSDGFDFTSLTASSVSTNTILPTWCSAEHVELVEEPFLSERTKLFILYCSLKVCELS